MKGNADQLIAEAINLLGKTPGSGSLASHKTERAESEGKEERGSGTTQAKIDSKKGLSPEQRFWFKLAESIVRGSE